MRTIILVTILASINIAGNAEQFSLSNAAFQSKLDKDLWAQIDACPKGEMTNGLFCALFFSRQSVEIHNQPGDRLLSAPVCYVQVANTTTTNYHFLNLPPEGTLSVELFDLKGKQVAKTATGGKFGTWTQRQIEDWFNEKLQARWHGRFFTTHSLFYAQANVFSIPQTFQVEQPGEYVLHLRVRLVQNKQDAAGKIYFETTCLPEVIAKVRVWPEDIAANKSVSKGQTNSLVK